MRHRVCSAITQCIQKISGSASRFSGEKKGLKSVSIWINVKKSYVGWEIQPLFVQGRATRTTSITECIRIAPSYYSIYRAASPGLLLGPYLSRLRHPTLLRTGSRHPNYFLGRTCPGCSILPYYVQGRATRTASWAVSVRTAPSYHYYVKVRATRTTSWNVDQTQIELFGTFSRDSVLDDSTR